MASLHLLDPQLDLANNKTEADLSMEGLFCLPGFNQWRSKATVAG